MKALKVYPGEIQHVIIEAYVPGGGFTVARLIRFKPDCKHIPVFLMSEHLTDHDLEEAKRIGILDCLVRPFNDLGFLETRLKNGAETQHQIAEEEKDVDPREHIIKELEKINDLPAMPNVYNEVDKLSKNSRSTTEQYSQVIELDPGITTQMLRLCNSSAFSFSRRITTVLDAVNLIGLQTVVDFVRTLSVVGAFKGKAAAFDTTEFWKHSIAVGVTAKLLAGRPEFGTKFDTEEEDPFMAGMVHDIGKQVLGHFFNEMYQMVLDEIKGGISMFEVEQSVLGLTHEDVGEALASKWQLPDNLVQVIGKHHTPAGGSQMVHLVHLSDICSKEVGFAFEEKPDGIAPAEATLDYVELEQSVLEELFQELETTVRTQVNETFSAIFK